MLTLADYWMNRDSKFRCEWTQQIQANGAETVRRINLLVPLWLADGIELEASGNGFGAWASGWRPALINAGVPNAAPKSKHMMALAGDVFDPDGVIDEWNMDHLAELETAGLWMEHPSATKSWSHLQSVPPRSGNRVFYP